MESDLENLKNKAGEFYDKQQYKQVISLLNDELLSNSADAELYLWRGASWNAISENDKAIADYGNAIELKKDYAEAYSNRGNSWDRKGDYEKAISDYNKAIELKPDFTDAYNNRGVSWQGKGDHDIAIADFTKAIELNPDLNEVYNNRGISWQKKGEYEKAITDYSKVIELKPDYVDAFIKRGISWDSIGQYDNAITDYNQAIELKSDSVNAHNNRGVSWGNKGEYDKAIADYNKAIDFKTDSAEPYYNRGISWANKNEYDKAIIDFTKAIELKPDYANAYYSRGLTWKIKSQPENAIKDFENFLEHTPDRTDIWAKRAKSNISELLKLQYDIKLNEIDAIIIRIKRLLSINSGCVTHYTSLTAAKAMLLESSSFRISEGSFLNDTSEGRELFKFLELKITPEKGTDDTVAQPFTQKPFIGSFVEEIKHDDLNLWRMYGKENKEEAKGCALTIKVNLFVEGINKVLSPIGDKTKDIGRKTFESDDINFYRVAYQLNDKPHEFIVPGLKIVVVKKLNKLLEELSTKVKDYDQTPDNKRDLEEAINSIAFLFKSDVYRSENEIRLVVKGVGFKKMFDNNVIPPKVYIDLGNIRPMVEKITLGPKVGSPDEWAAAFYYSYDKEEKPRILISHLPFK